MGKGSERRPCKTSRDEEYHRWLLATGKMTFKEFKAWYKHALSYGMIKRDGRVING
jgi:hypothetical protein